MITLLDGKPLFGWYIARLVVEYGHRKEICYDEIELSAQSIDTILISIINTIGRTYVSI
jgi:hypothetical protein